MVRLLEGRHTGRYKVYNLCSERAYPSRHFANRVAVFGFDDHDVPSLELLLEFVANMDA